MVMSLFDEGSYRLIDYNGENYSTLFGTISTEK